MDSIITTEKPIRYVANDNPGAWIVNLAETGLVTVTCLYMPIINEYYTHITDGLYIVIERFPKGDYLFDGYYEQPIRGRPQVREIHRAKTYEEAMTSAHKWLAMMMEEHRPMIEKYYPRMYGDSAEGQLEMALSKGIDSTE